MFSLEIFETLWKSSPVKNLWKIAAQQTTELFKINKRNVRKGWKNVQS